MKLYNYLTSSVLLASLTRGSVVDLVPRAPTSASIASSTSVKPSSSASVKPSSSASVKPTPVYNVYPKNRTEIAYEQRINSTLKGYGVDLNKIYFSKSTIPELGVFYWEAPITSQQASELNKSSDVSVESRIPLS